MKALSVLMMFASAPLMAAESSVNAIPSAGSVNVRIGYERGSVVGQKLLTMVKESEDFEEVSNLYTPPGTEFRSRVSGMRVAVDSLGVVSLELAISKTDGGQLNQTGRRLEISFMGKSDLGKRLNEALLNSKSPVVTTAKNPALHYRPFGTDAALLSGDGTVGEFIVCRSNFDSAASGRCEFAL